MNDDPGQFANRTRTSKTKLVAWGLLVGLLASTLIAMPQEGNTRILLTILTGAYALFMPVVFGIREGFASKSYEVKKLHAELGIILFVPVSPVWQFLILSVLTVLVVLPGSVLRALQVWSPQLSLALANLMAVSAIALPLVIAEVILVRRWGKAPPEDAFRKSMSIACIAGFLLGLPRAGFLSDWHLLLLLLTPLAYGVYMSRFRTVKRWQKALELESDRADSAEHARQIAEMQLSLLQAQIEPHFLYNTLASVQYLVRKDRDSADFMLTQLIRYLRHAMPKMRSTLSTLEQEFELADAYLQIASIRMGGRLTVVLDLPEHLRAFEFPPLIVQTLVENALKHGLEPKAGAVSIEVKAKLINAQLNVMVSDTGVGLGKSISQGTGTGLINIRNRLSAIYPGRSNLSISAAGDGGVVALVTIETMPSEGSNT
jgi:signal transduction histidine kinase